MLILTSALITHQSQQLYGIERTAFLFFFFFSDGQILYKRTVDNFGIGVNLKDYRIMTLFRWVNCALWKVKRFE